MKGRQDISMDNITKGAITSILLVGGATLFCLATKKKPSDLMKFGLDVVNEYGKSTTDDSELKETTDTIVEFGKKSIDYFDKVAQQNGRHPQ